MFTIRIISLCCICTLQLRISTGFNLDFEHPVVKQGPSGSLFGFSVAQHQFTKSGGGLNYRILVGAPNSTNKYQQKLTTPGTVYECDATSIATSCENEVPFDTFGNSDTGSEEKSHQWFGVSVKSGGSDKPVLACAHRYIFKTSNREYRLYEGSCRSATSSLRSGDVYTPCNSINTKMSEGATAPSYKDTEQCLAGIGIDIVETKQQPNYLVGTVGAYDFTGRVFQMTQQQDDDSAQESVQSKVDSNKFLTGYLGYSIDHGYFYDKKEKDIASGAPRTNSNGMVMLLRRGKEVNGTGFVLKVLQALPEASDKVQIASSFGFTLCSIDSDKDGFSELLVAAPYHAKQNYPGQGLVYYYRNNGKGKLVLKAKLSGKGVRINFGSAIANAGDMDLDGYDDLIIGAANENDGKGAIYIYKGSKSGLVETLSQKISASDVRSGLMGFGRSLSGGLDLDSNGYKDVLVGAYASDSAILLRSRPVIDIDAWIEFRTPYVDITKKDFVTGGKQTTRVYFKICAKYTERSGNLNHAEKVSFKVVADPGIIPRLMFTMSDSNVMNIDQYVSKVKDCGRYVAYLVYNRDGTIVVYPDITLVLYHKLAPDADRKPKPTPGKVTSLNTYPVLSPMALAGKAGHKVLTTLKFDRGCRPCVPDLSVETDKNQTVRLGTAEYPLNITIKNKGPDPAYAVGLILTLPEGITLSGVDVKGKQVQCDEPDDVGNQKTRTVCDNVYSDFPKGKVATLTLTLDVKSLSPFLTDSGVLINVTSANPEKTTKSDNVFYAPLAIKANADLALEGSFKTRQEFYGGKIKGESAITYDFEIGHLVSHRYYVINKGPDLLPSAVVTIHWPSVAVSGRHLLYLVGVHTENAKCTLKPGVVNELKYKTKFANGTLALAGQLKGKRSRNRREVASEESAKPTEEPTGEPKKVEEANVIPPGSAAREKSDKEGIVLDCRTKTAKCVSFTCEITKFRKGGSAQITTVSRIWNSTFLMDYYGKVVTIVSSAEVAVGSNVSYIKDTVSKNNVAELYTIIRPDFPSKGAESVAVWKIALAILAGVILLALLIFGLYKVGFFDRRRGSQMRKKKEADGADDTLLGSKKR